MSDRHVCDLCGKTLNQVNWSTVSIGDRYGASKWKLCGDCAAYVEDAIREAVKQ